jgi:hypothetical protein
MTDHNEIRALKASFRGVVDTAASLATLHDTIEGLDDHAEIDPALLEEVARVAGGHAVAAAALRGLIGTMQTRRGSAV